VGSAFTERILLPLPVVIDQAESCYGCISF
jgi:hypothetical protein